MLGQQLCIKVFIGEHKKLVHKKLSNADLNCTVLSD